MPPCPRFLVLAVCVLVATLTPAVVASGASPGSESLSLPPEATVIRRGDSNRPVVSLTFDVGADRGFAAYILDVLHAEGVRASFGPTGRWARQNPDLIQRMVTGHRGPYAL